jgi:plastocyanin
MIIPVEFIVKKGTTVYWRVQKCSGSNAKISECIKKGTLGADEAPSVRFDEPGIYHFTCSIYSKILLTIVVE